MLECWQRRLTAASRLWGFALTPKLLASIATLETSFSLYEIAPQKKLKPNEAFSYQ